MKYSVYPIVDINDLARALKLHYEIDMDGYELSTFLFGDDYTNDCYKSFYYDEMEVYEGKSWQNEERIRIKNCLCSILQDTIPGYKSVLIDVSW